MEKPKKRIKTFLGGGRLETPKPIQDDIFKLLLFKYPAGTQLKMGLVVELLAQRAPKLRKLVRLACAPAA